MCELIILALVILIVLSFLATPKGEGLNGIDGRVSFYSMLSEPGREPRSYPYISDEELLKYM